MYCSGGCRVGAAGMGPLNFDKLDFFLLPILYQLHFIKTLFNQGGIRDGVPTSNNEFKQLSVFYGHTKTFYRCSGVFDARCSMPPTSWEEMKMDFKSNRKSRIFHLLFDLTKLFYTL